MRFQDLIRKTQEARREYLRIACLVSGFAKFAGFSQEGFIKVTKRALVSYLIISIVFFGTGLIYLFNPFTTKQAEAAWFNDNWSYRRTLTFTHNATVSSPTKVKFDIDTTAAPADFQADCGDVRFTSPNGDILPYFYDSASGACDTSSTDFYVLIPSIINGSNYIYMYYGNPSATDGTRTANFAESTTTPSGGAATAGSEEKGPSPLAYWKFDDGQGTNAQDSTANNNDGTLAASTATPAWQTEDQCVSGKCLFYDGTDDKVTISNTIGNIQTVSLWVKPNTFTSTTPLLDVNGTAKITANSSGVISASGFTSPTIYVNGIVGTTLNSNEWQYVVITTGTGLSGSSLKISTDNTNFLKGFIDEIKLYGQALTSSQVKANYNARSNPEGVAQSLGSNIQSQPDTLSEGLVGYWKMDESSWTNNCSTESVLDSSGNSNDGAACPNSTGPTGGAAGKYNLAGSFDGSDDNVDVDDATSLQVPVGGKITIATWIKTSDTSATILGKNYNSSGNEYEVYLSSGLLLFKVIDQTGGGINDVGFVSNVNDGAWHQIVLTYDATNGGWQIYKDGILANSGAQGITTSTAASTGALTLGADSFAGTLDETRIYNRKLSANEVSQLYNFAPGPIGYWKMDEPTWTNDCSTTSVIDSSGLGKNGKSCPNGTGITTTVPGMYGRAGDFNGSSQYLDIASPNLPTDDFSYSAWVYPDTVASDQGIFRSNAAASTNELTLRINSSGGVTAGIDNANFSTSNSILTAGQWYHLELTRIGTTANIYVNGIIKATSTKAGTLSFSTCQLFIGVAPSASNCAGTPASYFDGKIDEAKVYNYGRTQAQVLEDYNAGHPAPGSPISSSKAYLKFDEGYGTSANDYSGNSKTFTLNTATSSWTNTGKFNKAWSGGGARRLSRAYDADLAFGATESLAISMWYKTDSSTNPGATEYLFSNTTANTDVGFNIYANTSGNFCFGIDDDTTFDPDVASCTTTDLYDGAWHHLTAVRDVVADKIYIYIDGLERDSDADTTTGTLNGGNTIWLGDYDNNDNGQEFTGSLDEVKIYRLALTPDQVKLDMNRSEAQQTGALGASSNQQPNSAANEYCPPDSSASSCTGPIGEWKFDEASGTTANDSSGNANTGTITAGTGGYVNGKQNKAYNFDGANTIVDAGSASSVDGLGPFAFEAWIYPRTCGENFTGSERAGFIAAKNSGNSQTSGGWLFLCINAFGTTNALSFVVDGSTDLEHTSSNNVVTLNKWQHVAVSWNGNMSTPSSARIYINGKEVTYQTTTGGSSRGSDASANLYLGNASSQDRTFDGYIDQARLFNYERSQAQVAYSYNKGGPVAWWKMDECQGTTLGDMSGNGYTGTLTIGGSGSQTSPGTCTTSGAWFNGVTGKRNYSMRFDGTDDYAAFGDMTVLEGSSQATWAFWINPVALSSNSSILSKISSAGTQFAWAISTGATATNLVAYMPTTNTDFATFGQTGAGGLANGSWQHVVVVFDGTQSTNATRLRMWINGAEKTLSYTGTIPATLLASTAAMGMAGNADAGGGFNSIIMDDVRIFNYSLTPTQIKSIFNDGAYRTGPLTGAP